MKIAGYILLFLLGAAACFFLMRGCKGSSTANKDTARDKEVDSLTNKVVTDSVQGKREIDSVKSIVYVVSKRADSLEKELSLTKSALKGKDAYIDGIIDRTNQSEQKHDTIASLAGCDSLKSAYPIARQLVIQYITTNDSLRQALSFLLSQKDTVIKKLNGLYIESNNTLFQVGRQYTNQGVELRSAIKNGNKKWGIGPGLGLIYSNSSIKPTIEIGVHYDVFKF